MDEIHYLISDASKKVDVEAHVLRYWEDELGLEIPRNDMGHRYYTELHIRLFRQIKELKEKGYQLKAIKTALDRIMDEHKDSQITDGILEQDMTEVLKETAMETSLSTQSESGISGMTAEEKMEQFQQIMNQVIGRAIEANNEKLSQDVSCMVGDKVLKELEYLMRVKDEKEDERFKQLDEIIRIYQKDNRGRSEAAASKIPFFKKKHFGRNVKKLI